MNKILLSLFLLLVSTSSNAALSIIAGDATWGTGGYSYCNIDSCSIYDTPGTTNDLSKPVTDVYPYDYYYLSNPQLDTSTGLYFQPSFGSGTVISSSEDGWFNITHSWKDVANASIFYSQTTHTFIERIFLSAGDAISVTIGGTALSSSAFYKYDIVSAVPIPTAMFLFLPALLMFSFLRKAKS